MSKDYFSNLTKREKHILVDKGTEAPFTGKYNDHFEAGIFICRACKTPLYESKTKFNSSCGWPSFDDEIKGSITRYPDHSNGSIRTEICCSNCDGHLGHVFDGEKITKKNTRHCVNSISIQFKSYENLNQAVFGAGCFWSVQKLFQEIEGVYMTQVGYMGGKTENPSYNDVCSGETNHAEVVQIYYDQNTVSYLRLLKIFWKNHNPTTLNQQGCDIGTQYRSTIFYFSEKQRQIAQSELKEQQANFQSPIVTQICRSSTFYRAEEYHQDYLNKNNIGGCNL